MAQGNDHSDFFLETLGNEVAPIEHSDHPDIDMLFASLQGSIAPAVQSRLSAHIATCESCRARYTELNGRMEEATQIHESRSRVPSLDVYVRERTARPETLPNWLRSLFETRVYVVAASAAMLALVLVVAIPLMRGPAVRTSGQIQALDERVANLQNQLAVLTSLSGGIPNQSSFGAGVVVADLTALDWENLTPYTVQPGDNWEGISERQVGDADLWPLVWLLNREVGTSDAAPPVGSTLHLPTPWSNP